MTYWHDFRATQEKIHRDVETQMANAARVGLEVDPLTRENKSAYNVILKLHPEVEAILENLANDFKALVPGSVIHPKGEMHATLARCLHFPEGPAQKDADLEKVARVVEEMLPQIPKLYCWYDGYALGATTLIVKGVPEEGYLGCANRLVGRSREVGLRLQLSWGLHSTIARYGAKVDPTIAKKALDLLREPRFAIPRTWYEFQAVSVAWFSANDREMRAEVYRSFPL